ncbi:MAG: hypothetical protein QOK16_188 [Solirubrobacteraceae bacterium]|jgi:hypothetical protein|nr:hypothetical protein [Solirubrobacteraceae bacterium]
MFHFTKKRAIVIAVVGSLALGAGAYAYFSAAGAGTGSATTGSSSPVTITQTNTPIAALYPGTAQPVHLDIKNNGAGTQLVRLVHLASVVTDKPACDASAFTMADVEINARMAAGATTSQTGSLAMSDTDSDQTGCQGATLTLTFSSN